MGDDTKNLEMLMGVSKRITEKSGRRLPSENIISPNESLAVQQRRYKMARGDRCAYIGGSQRHIIDIAALMLGAETEELIEGVLDSPLYVETITSFCSEGGRCGLLIYYQEMGPPGMTTGRYDPKVPRNTKMKRGAASSGALMPMTSKSVVAYRTKGHLSLEARNVAEEVFMHSLTASPPETTVVAAAFEVLEKVCYKSLHALRDWSDLNKSPKGGHRRDNFVADFDLFFDFMHATKLDLEASIRFKWNQTLLETRLNTPGAIKEASTDPQVYREVNTIVKTWITQMNLVLTQSSQLRREDDTFGPNLELEYWRRQLATLQSIIEHIKTTECRYHIFYLMFAKSRIVKKWKIIDNQITSACNEAADNVKYLYTLVKFFDPLYRCNPTTMGHHLLSLINSIRMIFTTSRHFNTAERITPLFVKMTNQMVVACRAYITVDGTQTIWKQKKGVVCSKIAVCLSLYTRYYNSYKRTVASMMTTEGEKPFGCSEMYIFGKFETFKKRIEAIVDVLETTVRYSILQASTLDGMNVFSDKFVDMHKIISKRKYDPLDHRKPEFDEDYEKYKTDQTATENEMYEFLLSAMEQVPSVEGSLSLLDRFDKLSLDVFEVEDRYLEVMEKFQEEIQYIRDNYNELRQNPLLPRLVPPVSGRIMWVRQLYKRIEDSMNVFKKRRSVIVNQRSQKCIMMYNSLCCVFLHYEQIYHESWCKFCDQVRLCLVQPIMIKNPINNMLLINFDPYIIETIREAENMGRLGLTVPPIAQVVSFCKNKLYRSLELVKRLLSENNRIRQSIPKLFVNLMRQELLRLNIKFRPALSTITWTSLEITEFCTSAENLLTETNMFVKLVSDMKEARVDEIIDYLSSIVLVELPHEAVDASVLFEINLEHAKKCAIEMERRSTACEAAVVELINTFMTTVHHPSFTKIAYDWLDPEKAVTPAGSFTRLNVSADAVFREIDEAFSSDFKMVHVDAMDMFMYFSSKITDAIVKGTKISLDILKNRAANRDMIGTELPMDPVVKTYMELRLPNFVITPSLDEMQAYFTRTLQTSLSVGKGVTIWGQRDSKSPPKKYPENILWDVDDRNEEQPPDEFYNFYRSVVDHKDTLRAVMALQGTISRYKPDVQSFTDSFKRFAPLWDNKREKIIVEFVDKNPFISDIKERFVEFDRKTMEVEEIKDHKVVGPIVIETTKAKLGLKVEAEAWKFLLGKLLSEKYKVKLTKIVDFINAQNKILARKLKDLDDVRIGMACLAKIRENFIEMDMDLSLMEEAYAVFFKYKIDVPKEDVDRIDALRYNFNNMITTSKAVQLEICKIQAPFAVTLIEGVKNLTKAVTKFDIDFDLNGPMVEGLQAKEASDRVIAFQARFDDLWDTFENITNGEILFGMEEHDYPTLHQRKKEFNMLSKLYGLYIQVINSIDGYYQLLWSEVDTDIIITELTDFGNRCRKLPKGMKDWPAYLELKDKIDAFNETCPLLELMANKAMKDRHWRRLEKVTGAVFDVESELFTLANVMEAPLLQFKEDVEDVCVSAVKEKDIEAKLKAVVTDWSMVYLTFTTFKTRGELLVKAGDAADIVAALEDSLMIMNSLLSNRYNAPFKKDIVLWVHKLCLTSEILEKWLIVQNLWIYLEAVFVGGDISKQLPAEAKRFAGIDKAWVKIMARARENPIAVECCASDDTMNQLLPYLLDQLEQCQKSLTGYLESKRLCFPRFFFISDPVLLEILGQASNPATIQPHLLSLFDAMGAVEFDEKRPDNIILFASALNERVPMEKPVTCRGGVENWLNSLLHGMRETIRALVLGMANFLNDPTFDFIANYEPMIGQASLLGIQLLWTRKAEEALNRSKIDRTAMKNGNQLFLDLLNALIEDTTKDLTKMQRTQLETMITIHLHQRDIFDDLVRLKVKSPVDFEWQKQARFYWVDDMEDCLVKICDVTFIYQNEYLGITERLCITPLTDRCYITLSQGIGMNMGGAPAGPAGTGKTETTKDMGRALGKFVVVFNCSDQMDFRGLGRIFKGLAQSGTWGCFDEFNRIELPVLSVAAQQIYIVLTARKERKAFFVFSDGDTVSMNIEFGLFLTMNPGYAGRQELPENLKIMFRTVAMMVPDRQIIIRVKLASCGFKENTILARKFFTLYGLCEEQLSKQVHYDFGLRNILSVLRTLGAQKRSNPNDSEDATVMRILREMNVSKLIDEDEQLFLSLVDDLFPGLKLQSAINKELAKCIANQTKSLGLMNHADFNLKCVQLYDTSLVRHGLMTLGPTGAGKTKVIHTLMRCFTEMGRPHKEMRMNPKAITAPQMFGRLDVSTNDWTDGIFSTLWRRCLKVKQTEFTWLVLDGPVDAVWIENLNSVLDDNKTLTLANGDRIVMAANSKIVFEPDNVDNASPATVSRMGMVFISSSVLKWPPLLDGWLLKRSDQEGSTLRPLFMKIYDDLHLFVQSRLAAKMAILEAIYIRQCCDVIGGLIDYNPDRKSYPDKHLEKFFLFGLMWSLGAVLELEDRKKMENFVLAHPSKLGWPKPAESDTIFEYCISDDGKWQHWSNKVDDYIYPSDSVPDYSGILVPNVDNVRTNFLIDLTAKQNKPVLLIGEQGTAKTVMIKGYMSHYNPEITLSKSLNFSSATTPNMYQRIIESYVDKRVGTTYGPPQQRKMTIFIDDINMPIVNEWGDQVTNEIVRQMMEAGGFYSLDKPGDFNYIVDILLAGAMIHPGGGRNDIPPRLKRQFCVYNCTLPSNSSMDKIFSVIGQGYFCIERFNAQVVEFLPKIIPLTRHCWQLTKIKMLPTPAKFHYVFNLRDLSRIWQGMLTIKGPECTDQYMIMKLWQHECNRVISDRFVTAEDREWFMNTIEKTSHHDLEEDFMFYPSEPCRFVDFLREAPEPTGDEPDDFCFDAPKVYEEWHSQEYVLQRVYSYMESYNESVRGAGVDLVFFNDALMHLLTISRLVRTSRGNALLVGVGGSGKQSLTRLASFMAGYEIYQITLTRSYNTNNLMDDLKFLYRIAGVKGHGVSFIFTDNEIKDEAFLEFINNVLSSGEVANLFPKDELDEILSSLINILKEIDAKKDPTPDNLYELFISRSRANLHIVLCFSPVGEKFRNRSLKFPGLISGCTMDWFSKWPRDALIAVSGHMLDNFPMVATDEIKVDVIEATGATHDTVADMCTLYFERFRRQTYVTPKSFLSFLSGYQNIYLQKHEGIKGLADKMLTGLDKLVEAALSVDILRKELAVKEVEIAAANKTAEGVLIVVQAATEIATKIKEEATITKERAEGLVKMISADSAIAEAKLIAAKPALEEAEAALQTIKGADIATVRKLGKPPYLVTLIMDAVLILFKKHMDPIKPDMERNFLTPSWAESLKVMADTKFLSNLQQYPKDTINAEIVDLMQPYLSYPLYTFEAAKTACGNVAGLIQWTCSMAIFYGINKEVLPLKANLAKQNARLAIALSELDAAMTLLRAKEAEVAECQREYDQAMAIKTAVLEDAAKCQMKMDAATALIEGLGGERIRWTEQSKQFKSEIERLVGDVLILIGFLSYSGPFNQDFRTLLMHTWMDELIRRRVPVSLSLSILDSLTDTVTVGEWNLQGLPNDDLSVQNGIIVTQASRYPLLIDPQTQGKQWIMRKESENQLCVTSLNHKYFRQHMEDCISLGYPMLIEDVLEELDPALDNVLEKNYIKMGNTLKVRVGDKEVDLCSGFKVYITTKLPNPSYSPEVSARCSVIDFTVTQRGLEDQLLARVIMSEKSELETERTMLITDVTANKKKMKELEDNLLYKLTSTKGSLVEDVTVIQVLNTTKETAAQVGEKLIIARETEIKINGAREEFRSVATRGSVLYFLVVSMAEVNCMYQTSLVQYLERFDVSLERSEKSLATTKRINYIIDYLTYEIFKYKCRGLYELHKYMFVLMLALKIDMQKEFISSEEFQYLFKGGAALDLNACPPKPSKWITDLTWLNLVEISKLRQYQYILTQVESNDKSWKTWYEKDAPEENVIPDGYNTLDIFRRLLLIRAWCPDRILVQSRKYIHASMGARFAEAVILNYELTHAESRAMTPLICFLSMGSDPTPYIEGLAKKKMIQISSISMGQGQEVHARKLIANSLVEGSWVLLQNCHLGLEYMTELLILFVETEKSGVWNPEFRVWLTSEPHPSFPITLLQMCIKFTNEPPAGIKAGLKRTYSTMNQDWLDYCTSPFYLPLIFGISYMHTIVQERRKFGPLGWNIPYEFNSSDWLCCCMFVQNHLDELEAGRGISWSTVRYMFGEVQYGGRVTDDYDKRLLNTFCKCWFGDFMFSEEFVFYTGYRIMKHKQIQDYLNEIELMSTVDAPQAYGLHPNADITFQSNSAANMLDDINAIQPKQSSVGGGETREQTVYRLTIDMLEKTPPNYDPFAVKERLRIMGNLSPMNIFLRQEIDRMNRVIKLVRITLKDLLLGIDGTIIMNEGLRKAFDFIYDAKIPPNWLRYSWVSSTLGFWFTEFLERNLQFNTWCFGGRPISFWMTGFFNPQGFLTAMRQEVTRAHKGWALDTVVLHNDVTKMFREDVKNSPAEGVFVFGIYLDGAGWNRRDSKLCESTNKILYTLLPVCHIYAINSTSPKDPKLYTCPVYKKPNRTGLTYIAALWLPSSPQSPEHWILRGVALLCDIK